MPNRILKESICTSESLNQLSWFEQVFFDHLIVNCDDYGRMDARPAILKAKLFPLNEAVTFGEIENALKDLVRVGCVRLYDVDEKPYLCLPSWEKHQTRRAHKSKYPAPVSKCNDCPSGGTGPVHPADAALKTAERSADPASDNSRKTSEVTCMHLHADENRCNQMSAGESKCKQMSPYSGYGIRESGYENRESGCGNESGNKKHPVAPQGAETDTEKAEDTERPADEAERSEGLTVETARGSGEKKPADHSKASVQQKRFAEFWHHYPRKVGKGAAEKSWDKIRPGEKLLWKILSAVDRQKQCDQWQREDGRYIPYPATWLNQKRWEDEPDVPEEISPKPGDPNCRGAPPGGDPPDLPADLIRAKKQHEEAIKRFAAGKGSWEDLVPE